MVLVGNMKDVPELSWCAVSDTCTAHQEGEREKKLLSSPDFQAKVAFLHVGPGVGKVRCVS